ncbi:MAG TPA: hypothetical protein VGO60_01450 [Iamia sp.]|nr:hypothetical protein [Iamia sp.]
MTPARPATRPRSLAWLAAIAAAVAVLVALSAFTGPVPASIPGSGSFISARYDPPTSGVEVGLDLGDGQLFATHAADPFLDQPAQIRGGPEEQAYRFQRPLFGWLGWLASGGRPGAVPWAVVGLTVASVVALVVGAGRLLRERGADPRLALVLLATPGVLADLQRVGPEALGVLLVLVGAVAWTARRPIWVPIVLFAAAGLCRETLLLVPAALLLHDLVRSDPAGRRRAVLAGVAVVAPYAGWVVALRAIVGAWPSGTVDGRLSVIPFAGLVDAVSSWTALDLVFVAAVLATAVLVLARRAGEPWMRWVVAAHLLLAATLGEPVWVSSRDWGRVLLPLSVIAVVALAPRRTDQVVDPADRRTGDRSEALERTGDPVPTSGSGR